MTDGHKDLRVFFLEDNLDDIELELHELRKAGFAVEYDYARSRGEFLDKFPSFAPDIMLADYSLPDITGMEAIQISRQKGIEVPVILITGEGNEQIAVDSLRLGAIDYIIKRNISGLPARVSRALEIWEDRRAKERAEGEEKRLQQLLFETQKMEAVGRLAGGIAHDFNNILTGIMGFAELSLSQLSTGTNISSQLRSIISLSERGADLIKQLLIFSRRLPMEFREVDVNVFVGETVNFLKRILEETIEIKLDLGKNLPRMSCDTGQFTRVLMNIALNARDAMKGNGTITIRTETVEAPSVLTGMRFNSEKKRLICISIADSGVGIEKEDLEKIFEPFYTSKDLGKGTGLGLSIAYSVVKAHGGNIEVVSRKGEGTAFKVYIPAMEVPSRGAVEQFFEKIPVKRDHMLSGKETILVAEDDQVLREMVTSFLASYGYTIISSKDGDEAVQRFKSATPPVDIVVSDMLMPSKGGIDLFLELRKIDENVKFILVTGYSLASQDEKVLEKINSIVAKPFTPMAILKTIRTVLSGAT